jgi:hypothetical protein
MTIQSKHRFVSDNEGDDVFEEMDSEFRRLRLNHQRFNHASNKARELSSDMNGVAIFDRDEEEDENGQGYSTDDEDSQFTKGDNETVATCTVSVSSSVSSKSTTFVSAIDAANDAKTKGSRNVKDRLRAIASLMNPKTNRTNSGIRSIWNGKLDEEDQGEGVEVEYLAKGDLYEC